MMFHTKITKCTLLIAEITLFLVSFLIKKKKLGRQFKS